MIVCYEAGVNFMYIDFLQKIYPKTGHVFQKFSPYEKPFYPALHRSSKTYGMKAGV